MRLDSIQGEAERLQGLFGAAIERCGQRFVLTPSPARAANGETPRTLFATVENPNANDVGHLRIEGDMNAENPAPVILTFPGAARVLESDRFEFNGYVYTLLNALPQTFQGVVMGIRCVAIRMRRVEERRV